MNADGCELDRDGDGIVDGDDACPDLYAKTPNGCPEPVAATPPAEPLAPPAGVYAAGSSTEAADIPRRLILEGVNFDFDKTTLRQADRDIIDQNAADLKEWGDVKVEISGHTDSIGSDRYNMGLSLRRANSARSYLISKGIAADRLVTKGYGEAQPIANNETEEGRFKNRRVELNQVKN